MSNDVRKSHEMRSGSVAGAVTKLSEGPLTILEDLAAARGRTGPARSPVGTPLAILGLEAVDLLDLAGGSLTVSMTTPGDGERLAIAPEGDDIGDIAVQGSTVTFSGAAIGHFAAERGDDGTARLRVELGRNATPAAVEALIASLSLVSDTSERPASRVVSISLQRADGARSSEILHVGAVAERRATGPTRAAAPASPSRVIPIDEVRQPAQAAGGVFLLGDSDCDTFVFESDPPAASES
jgi:hypothetical protein